MSKQVRESIKESILRIFEGLISQSFGNNQTDDSFEVVADTIADASETEDTPEVSDQAKRVLLAVQFHFDQEGVAPTQRELAAYTGTDRFDAMERIDELIEAGYVRKTDARSRNIDIQKRIPTDAVEPTFRPESTS